MMTLVNTQKMRAVAGSGQPPGDSRVSLARYEPDVGA
jgi:hypothetical protein